MLRNLRCWLFTSPPRFPLWLLSRDLVEIDGHPFIFRGWPKRIRDEQALRACFAADDAGRLLQSNPSTGRETVSSPRQTRRIWPPSDFVRRRVPNSPDARSNPTGKYGLPGTHCRPPTPRRQKKARLTGAKRALVGGESQGRISKAYFHSIVNDLCRRGAAAALRRASSDFAAS